MNTTVISFETIEGKVTPDTRIKQRTYFKCVVCGKLTAGRVPRDGWIRGDRSERFPRRHNVDGEPCPGNIEFTEWISVKL